MRPFVLLRVGSIGDALERDRDPVPLVGAADRSAGAVPDRNGANRLKLFTG
jgi:hypothetical protein